MKMKSLFSCCTTFWRRHPAIWALIVGLLPVLFQHILNRAIPNPKDEMFIEMAKKLTGQQDEATVSMIKEQVISYLTERYISEYVTKEDLINTERDLSYLFKTNMLGLTQKIDALSQSHGTDARYNKLLCEIGAEMNGRMLPVRSELSWRLMRETYKILKDDYSFSSPYIASALLQTALRQGYPSDESKFKELKDMVLFALSYYEKGTLQKGIYLSVYKTIATLMFDTENFPRFLRQELKNNPELKKQLRDGGFVNDSFFSSPFWPEKAGDLHKE